MRRLAVLFLALPAPALAAPPQVVTDIPPVASLAGMVLGELGEPVTLIGAGAEPHGHNLRPSEARALQDAGLVVWTGEALTPWLGEALESLAPDAARLELLDIAPVVHPARQDGAHGDGDEEHDGEHDHTEEAHGADRHEHGHEEDAPGADDRSDHAHEMGQDAHDHGDTDPHAWLDPVNAAAWLDAIAEDLARLDPENAATYRANADTGAARLEALTAELTERLEPVQGRSFMTYHDSFQYFGQRFGLDFAGAIAGSDADQPGPARVAALQDEATEHGVVCLFTEPQFEPRLARLVTEGTDIAVAEIDPLGTTLEPGPGLYPALLEGVADAMIGCLGA